MAKQTVWLPVSEGRRMGLKEAAAHRKLSGGLPLSEELLMAEGVGWIPGIGRLGRQRREEIIAASRELDRRHEREWQEEDSAKPASAAEVQQFVQELRDRLAFRDRMERETK